MTDPADVCGHAEASEEAQRDARARQRQRDVRRVFWVTLVFNTVVALAKGVYGLKSGSLSIGTDALHSVLDAASNVLALLGLKWAAAPADARHPYGRHKIEMVAALGIGVLIIVGLFELATAAIRSLVRGTAGPTIGWGGFAIVLATIAVNYGVSRYEQRRGRELGSALLRADARHTQSDIYASAAVIASFIAVRAGITWADGVATLALVVLIGHVAWEVFRDNVPVLIDAAVLDPAGVADLARSVVRADAEASATIWTSTSIHHVRSRGSHTAVELDLHLEVAPEMSVEDAHRLARQIERELKVKFPQVSDVIIHIEPRRNPSGELSQ